MFLKDKSFPNTVRVQKLLVSDSLRNVNSNIQFETQPFNVPVSTNAYLVGSPASEVMAARMFGYKPETGFEGHHIFTGLAEYPFRWVMDHNIVQCEATHHLQRHHDGTATYHKIDADTPKLPNWGIELDEQTRKHLSTNGKVPKRLYPVETNFLIEGERKKLLSTDYLLITRIPNVFSRDAVDQNKFVVSIAGTHGMGTIAFEKVINDQRARMMIGEALHKENILQSVRNKEHVGFQVLLEVKLDYRNTVPIFKEVRIYGEKPVLFGGNWDWFSMAKSVEKRTLEENM